LLGGADDSLACGTITSTVIVQVHAVDNVALAGVTLSLNGTLLPPEVWWRYEFTPPAPGLYTFTATATDTAGNVGNATTALRVFDPADTTPPRVEITSPAVGDVITYLTDITGSVTDEHLEFYRLQYALAGSEQWTTFFDSAVERGVPHPDGGVTDGLLGVFDPTLLQRDDYDLRVVAQDINGLTTIVQLGLPVSVEAQAVLGNFRLDFTDLSIPLAGIPIQIHRTYDTLNAARSGDFGYGWTLGIAQANVRESVRVSEAERSGITAIFGAAPFRPGTRVYLTNPAGRRVGFTFDPVPEGGVLGTIWRPRFTPDPGVYDQLTVADLPLSQRDDGTFAHYPVNLPYNPSQYSLTTKDGHTYRYDQFTGLLDVTDRNQNVLTYTADGITSSTGAAIRFHRDAQDRIVAIEDPDGNTIAYTYNTAGDLVAVEDQAGNRSTYGYLASPPHYLTTNSCPSGVCIASTAYDAAGRLTALTDSLGHSATRQFDVLNNVEIVGDLLGNETTILFDTRGNVLATTDPLGHTTRVEYDAQDNPVSQTDARGYTTLAGYDDRGNLTSLTDPMGNTWQRTYDERNLLLDETDPQGNRTQLRYDVSGNLVAVTDALGNETRYGRDLAGRVVMVTDSNQHAISFAYHAPGDSQPAQVTFADGSTLLTDYNAWGQPTRTANGRGDEFVFWYDATGKLVETRDPLGGTVRMEYFGDQLVRVVDPRGHETLYEYDAAGRMVRMTDATGESTLYAYDANGRMVEQTDPLGRVTRYGYRADGRIESQADPLGTVTTYAYDAAGNPTAITQTPSGLLPAAVSYNVDGLVPALRSEPLLARPAGDGPANATGETAARTTSFRYDSLNRIIERVDPLGQSQSFVWDEVGQLTGWTNENGGTTTFAYDPLGRLLQTTDALGGVETRTYDGQGNLLSITDRRAGVTRFEYDARDRLVERQDSLGGIYRWEYDVVGNVVSEVDENGYAERFAYDAQNRLVQHTDARNASQTYSYDAVGNLLVWTDARGSATHYGYDDLNRLTSITDALGGMRQFEYDAVGNTVASTDANGQTTLLVYDSRNRPVQRMDSLGGTEHFEYDDFGNLHAWTDARGNATRYTYDAMDQQVSITDALAGLTSFRYDPAGNLTAVTDANGHTSVYAYDALHRIVRRTDALGGVRSLTYDAVGNVTSQQGENGHLTHFQYDALHRLVAITDALGGSTVWIYDAVGNPLAVTDANGHTTRYEYDDLHRLVRQLDPLGFVQQLGYDEAGNLILATDELGYATTYAYDAVQRLTSVTDAVGLIAAYAYDAAGNLTAARDGLQRTTAYAYDGLDRLVSITDPRDSVTSFTYDAVGNRLSVTDPLDQTTQYAYDGLNRVITATDPLGRDRQYAYDPVGNLTQYTDRNGRVRTFEYDALDRGIAEDWWNADEQVRRLRFTYDAVGNLTGASDADSEYAFTYDALDRMTQADNAGTPRAPHLILDYTYDPVGNLLSVRDNSGVSVTSAYDARELLTSRTWQGGQIEPARVEFASSARGELTELRRYRDAEGLQLAGRSTFAYDARGRLAELAHRDAFDAVLAEYDYTFDLADQLIRAVHHGQVSEYTYDLAGQLTDANHSEQSDEAYAYDANGNRLGESYVVGPNNQVLSDAVYDYEHDAEGNLVRKTERATGVVSDYTYDHRNRLIRFEQRSAGGIMLAEAAYVYDVFDRRIVKSVDPDGAGPAPQQETRYVYDGLNAWADFDALNQLIARYLHGEGLDNLLARWRPIEGTAWYLTDHLGTVRDIADATGVIINHLDYDSFGRLVSQTDPAVGDRFAFTGREYDPELDMYYYRARYYDPQLGRFISQDPLGFEAGDSNLYRYVGNAPLAARDPLGLAGDSLFYGLMGRRASMAAGAAVGGVLGFACGWVEGFTEATVSARDGDTDAAAALAWERALSYAAIGTALGGTLAGLPSAVQFYGGGILMGVAAGMIVNRASQDPWQVTAVRVGCVVVSAAVGPPAQRWLTGQFSRLPFLAPPRSYRPPRPKFLTPRARFGRAVERSPTPKPPSSKEISEPAPSRPLRQLLFRFMEKPVPGRTLGVSGQAALGNPYPATLSQRLAGYKHWKATTGMTSKPTQAQFRRFVGAHRPNSRGSTLYNEDGGFAAWSEAVGSAHGNTVGSQTAWLYRLENDVGGFLKWGVSQDPFTRYPGAFIRDKVIIPLKSGPRRIIISVERDLVERLPGPLNFEPWAGSRSGGTRNEL
jgi:RHS repeat-associated protein